MEETSPKIQPLRSLLPASLLPPDHDKIRARKLFVDALVTVHQLSALRDALSALRYCWRN